MVRLIRYLLAIGALYAPFSLVWAADPVCVETGGRKICYSAAADRVTPQTFDLSMRGMCHVATDTGAVTEWTGTAYISSATCPGSAGGTSASSLGKAEDAAHTSGDTGVAILVRRCDTASVGSDTDGDYSVPCVDSSGRLWTSSVNYVSENNPSDADVAVAASGFTTVLDIDVGATQSYNLMCWLDIDADGSNVDDADGFKVFIVPETVTIGANTPVALGGQDGTTSADFTNPNPELVNFVRTTDGDADLVNLDEGDEAVFSIKVPAASVVRIQMSLKNDGQVDINCTHD